MSALFLDAHPKMEAMQICLLRQAPPSTKLKMLAELNDTAHILALSGLRSRYSEEGDERLQRRLADLLLGEDLARRVFGEQNDVT
jgi:hypothetical protein